MNYEDHIASERSMRLRACGNFLSGWQNIKHGPSVIYERAPTGLADIWSSMLTAFWWSQVMERRFEVHWPESEGTIDFEANDIAHIKSLERLVANYTYFKRTHLHFRAEAWQQKPSYYDIVLTGNRGLTNWAFKNGYLPYYNITQKLGAFRTAGCALHQLALPTRQAYQLARPLLKAIQQQPTVCIHIRAGLMLNKNSDCTNKRPLHRSNKCKQRPDDEMHGAHRAISVQDVGGFIACAQNLSKSKRNSVKWFITADSASLRRDFVHQFGQDKIILAPWEPEPFASYQSGGGSKGGTSIKSTVLPNAFDPNALRRTFAEWYTLAHCNAIVVSRSGFSRTAAVVARSLRDADVRLVINSDDHACRSPSDARLETLLIEGGAGI